MTTTATQTAYLVRFMYFDEWEDAWFVSHEEAYTSYAAALAASHSWDGTVCPTDNPVVSVDWAIVPA